VLGPKSSEQNRRRYLYFTGTRLWLVGSRVTESVTAYSGKNGKFDPIPDGSYWIVPSEMKRLEFWDDLRQKLLGAVVHRGLEAGWLAHQTGWGSYRLSIRQTPEQAKRSARGNFLVAKFPGARDVSIW
jgi:hypothetical protein